MNIINNLMIFYTHFLEDFYNFYNSQVHRFNLMDTSILR